MDTEDLKKLGEQVQAARVAKGWSQADLHRVTGVAENTISDMERGRKKTQPAKRRLILDALGLVGVGVPHPDEFPADVQDVLGLIGRRLSTLDEDSRERMIGRLYGFVLREDETLRQADQLISRAAQAAHEDDEDSGDTPGTHESNPGA